MTIHRRDGNESPDSFAAWLRVHPRLDSQRHGFGGMDFDLFWHQFGVYTDSGFDRRIENLMGIEVKTFGAVMSRSQAGTYRALRAHFAVAPGGRRPLIKYIPNDRGEMTASRWWGMHLLVFSGDGPCDSAGLWWDRKPITTDILGEVMEYRRSPLTLKRRTERRHHKLDAQGRLPFAD